MGWLSLLVRLSKLAGLSRVDRSRWNGRLVRAWRRARSRPDDGGGSGFNPGFYLRRLPGPALGGEFAVLGAGAWVCFWGWNGVRVL